MFDITSLSSLLTDSHMIFCLMSINYFNGVVPPQILVGLKCAAKGLSMQKKCFNIFENVIYSCCGIAEFSEAITPVFSVTGNHSNRLHLVLK